MFEGINSQMANVLILCTGNSCRSQMAEGILKSMSSEIEVHSAGTQPTEKVHPKAIHVMKEIDIDIRKNIPKNIDEFLKGKFDFVITVCDDAKKNCPVFTGSVKNRIHIGFDDPAKTSGSEDHILSEFRRVRDEIHSQMQRFYRYCIPVCS